MELSDIKSLSFLSAFRTKLWWDFWWVTISFLYLLHELFSLPSSPDCSLFYWMHLYSHISEIKLNFSENLPNVINVKLSHDLKKSCWIIFCCIICAVWASSQRPYCVSHVFFFFLNFDVKVKTFELEISRNLPKWVCELEISRPRWMVDASSFLPVWMGRGKRLINWLTDKYTDCSTGPLNLMT